MKNKLTPVLVNCGAVLLVLGFSAGIGLAASTVGIKKHVAADPRVAVAVDISADINNRIATVIEDVDTADRIASRIDSREISESRNISSIVAIASNIRDIVSPGDSDVQPAVID